MKDVFETVLHGYSAAYFSEKKGAGLLFLAATMLGPAQGLAGLVCSAVCVLAAQGLGFHQSSIRHGLFGVNGLLTGLAIGHHFPPTPHLAALLVLSGIMTAVATAFLQTSFEGVFALPQFSLGFVLVTTILLTANGNPASLNHLPPSGLFDFHLPGPIEKYLCAIAAVFFRHDVVAGLLVFTGLLYSSRIAVVLSVIGFAAGTLSARFFISNAPAAQVDFTGYNFAVCAIGLGGVFVVPSFSSYCIAALAAALCAPIAQWGSVTLGHLGLDLLSWPFLLVSYVFLAALRARASNTRPELTAVPAASPEQNLAIAQSLQLRQKQKVPTALGLPFIGAWQVTQGVNGEFTHQEKWRHALDFSLPRDEAADSEAERSQLSRHPAYGLPVTTPQAGIVARRVDGIADNDLGVIETEKNWGNFLSIRHDDGTYSLLAHLKNGSIRVRPGERVNPGDLLALCGNSGRSPIPHIHFQLQKTPEPGGETLPFLFSNYIQRGAAPTLLERSLPQKGETVENLVVDPGIRSAFNFIPGQTYAFDVETKSGRRAETLTAAIDLYGWRYLESDRGRTRLYYHLAADTFYFNYCSAKPGSLLFALLLTASKVPLTDVEGLRWKDELPLSSFLRGFTRLGAEFILPFFPGYGVQILRRFQDPGDEERPAHLKLAGIESTFASRWPKALENLTARAVFAEGLGPLNVTLHGPNPAWNLTAIRTL